MVRYHVIHETRYDYGSAVSLSQQMLHLRPRAAAWQTLLDYRLLVEPEASWHKIGTDAFGNPVEWLAFFQPHEILTLHSEMRVDIEPHVIDDLSASIAWDALAARLAYTSASPSDERDLEAKRYLFRSPHVPIKQELAAYAAACFPPDRPVLEATTALMEKIYNEFEFDPEATTNATPVLEVMANKRGVCQDFAHLMIACLRALGIPARYMSGYLLTHPPPGKPRMVGADASHAWIAVYSPGSENEWIEFDPTNNLLPDTQHITIGWGRDFSDVSPMRGVILGGGGHEPEVAVTVTPENEDTPPG